MKAPYLITGGDMFLYVGSKSWK